MAIINGFDNSNDILVGTAGSDVISGLSGNDTITGGAGVDSLYGGTGDDTFFISGSDTGRDSYFGGDGVDRIYVDLDVTTNELLLNATYASSIDVLYMYGDINGTAGNDVIDISAVTSVSSYTTINLNDGDDRFVGHVGVDYAVGGAGNDSLEGGSGGDHLTGGSGIDSLYGGTGDDTFYISGSDTGRDSYFGGDGSDRIYVDADVTTSELLLNATYVTNIDILYMYGDINGTAGNDVIDISAVAAVSSYTTIGLQDGDDRFVGHVGADYAEGGAGNDRLYGGAAGDFLTGGSGIDSLYGGTGDDTFHISGSDTGRDYYFGGDGSDRIYVSSDVTTSELILNASRVSSIETLYMYGDIIGTAGNDLIDISAVASVTSYTTIALGDGSDRFIGHVGADYVEGGAGIDRLYGGAGSDFLTGGSGIDSLYGGTGDDTFYISGSDTARDSYFGGDGADRIYLYADVTTSELLLNATYASSIEQLYMYGDIIGTIGNDLIDISAVASVSSYSTINLNDGNDRFIGHVGADYVNGGAGNDTLDGGAGGDNLAGGSGNDTFITSGGDTIVEAANEGIDQVNSSANHTLAINVENLALTGNLAINGTGNASANIITGNGAINVLSGGGGADSLYGGGGADSLNGDAGRDSLYGGVDAVRDVFVFSNASDSGFGSANRDLIYDFVSGVDDISLAGIDANAALAGDQAFAFTGITATAHSVWYLDTGSHLLIRGDTNGDKAADFEILVMSTNTLLAGDFLL